MTFHIILPLFNKTTELLSVLLLSSFELTVIINKNKYSILHLFRTYLPVLVLFSMSFEVLKQCELNTNIPSIVRFAMIYNLN